MNKEIKEHVRNISDLVNFPTEHIEYLWHLKNNGFEPKIIYDIGACVGHWTKEAKKIWPDAEIILFDALDFVEFLYHEKFPEHKYYLGVLSNSEKFVKFYQDPFNLGANSYYKEIGSDYKPEKYVYKYTKTLDSVVKEMSFPKPDLIKIDVQGSEKDILEGSIETLKSCRHLIVEMQDCEYNEGAPKVDVTMPYIESLGFRCIAPKFSDNGPDADYGFIRNSRLF